MRPVARPESAGEAAAPIRLNANQPPDRFYRGGERIARFRGAALRGGDRVPEDWIASTTSVRGQEPAGLTILPGGVTLSQAVADRPLWWLGESHVRAFGRDTRLLVKLLDAGQRLPVHAHPPTDFARSHLGAAHGKAEAWYILSPGVVHLGLTRALGADELREIVRTQQSGRLLDTMHRLDVSVGDYVFVPPGMLHSIGEGVFLAEVQEPEDLSILVEWEGFELDGANEGHLGIGFESALRAVDRSSTSARSIASLVSTSAGGGEALPSSAGEYFRLQSVVVDGPVTVAAGFAVVIVLTGAMTMSGQWGVSRAKAGDTYVVPAAAGALRFGGSGSVLVARPPAPQIGRQV